MLDRLEYHTQAYARWMAAMDAAENTLREVLNEADNIDRERERDGVMIDEVMTCYETEYRSEAEYAPLTRRAATDNSGALVDEVLHLITGTETRKRQRRSRTDAFRQTVEGFLGDLLAARGGWFYRPTGRDHFTDGVVSYRNFAAAREGLKKLGLSEEIPWVADFGRTATRFRAAPELKRLAAQHGIQPSEADKHFILPLPKHPLRLKSTSTWVRGHKIDGEMLEIPHTDKVTALERTIIDLNAFLDRFVITGGTHRGYYRQFECGKHPTFQWNLGGRLYSQGKHNYQQIGRAERLNMTIDGKPVCEVDVRASTLTIFHATKGQPLDFTNNPDPYAFRELSAIRREVVKGFIVATFGNGQCPVRWPKEVAEEHEKVTGKRLSKQYPASQVRDVVTGAYPFLRELRRDTQAPPLWAKLMFLESEAVLKAMLTLQAAAIPSLSMWDGLIVPYDNAQLARDTLAEMYRITIGAIPCVVIRYPDQ
jgi:hypothetical protein